MKSIKKKSIKKKGRVPMLIRILIYGIVAGLAAWTALVAAVCVMEYTVPQPDATTQAIIVLGAQINTDGTPKLQLQNRLDMALEQYTLHQQTIVVCGAQGADEPMTEAQAMRSYLLAHGVPDADILLEDASFNTRQNLSNAKALLGEEVKKVLIVTSDYHLPRAMALARDIGFDTQGAGSPIKPIYWAKNHYREALAWVKYIMQRWGILAY